MTLINDIQYNMWQQASLRTALCDANGNYRGKHAAPERGHLRATWNSK